jgi:hypothetical protein
MLQDTIDRLFPWDFFKASALSKNYLPSELTDQNFVVAAIHLDRLNTANDDKQFVMHTWDRTNE